MTRLFTFSRGLILAAALATAPTAAAAQTPTPITGAWHGTVTVNDVPISFRYEIAENAGILTGVFFDGDRRLPSADARRDGDTLTFSYPSYAATLTLRLVDGALEGGYARGSRTPYPVRAVRATAPPAATGAVPSIAGVYVIPQQSPKGETAWRLIVRQKGADVSASILRVDGDTGAITGRFADGRAVLSHFSGARPQLLEVTPNADGTLTLLQNRKTTLTAIPAARATGDTPAPTDPSRHTTIRSADEPFRFSFADLEGRTVTQDDPRFRGKVVAVNLTGSWCPNCHDEAPFLAELHKKYRSRGLEVVAFSFEEAEQLAAPTRLKAFIAQYGLQYTVLLAGEPDQLAAKVPQVDRLNAFPTTLFIGRDGRLKATHAGFPSAASGAFYTQAKRDFEETVERLLDERPSGSQ
jgi:thiol-disulfide isomerase/thioredoxin